VPVSPLIFLNGQASGLLPTTKTLPSLTFTIPGGASNALVDSSTMYVVGQCLAGENLVNDLPACASSGNPTSGLITGMLTVVNLANNSVGTATSISDGVPMGPSRLIEADDNTLWIGMTKCTNGARAANNLPYGCLTMYNTSTQTVTMLESYIGDLTGIASVTGLSKIYVAQGGQVYIYKTTDGSSINNQYVTVAGTAMDVAYMDAITDGNNTVY
jgi:hypothetical protein